MSNLPKSTSDGVGAYYEQMNTFYQLTWDEVLHAGYWHDEDDTTSFPEAQTRLTDMMIDRLPVQPGQRILDVGCGYGLPALRLAQKRNCRVIGITISQVQVERANELAQAAGLGDRAQFHLMDATNLSFEAASFDGAWAFESLFHLSDRRPALQEIQRVLRPGARLAITDAFEKAPMTAEQSQLMEQGFQLHSMLPFDQYPPLLTDLGFELIENLDISPNIIKTIDMTLLAAERRQEELLAAYGMEFLTQVGQTWPTYRQIYREKMGYCLITAQKSAQGVEATFAKG